MVLSNYRPDIDGLRAVAVIFVVLNHLDSRLMPGGYVGVDVFFVISGYLITAIISREVAEGRFSFRSFYERRVRRIFPALFVMLAVTLAACYLLMLPSDYVHTLRVALSTLLFSSNLLFWQQKTDYFDVINVSLSPLMHTWSLGVEEQFYLIFPVLLLLCYRYFRSRVLTVLLVCALVSFGLASVVLLARGNSLAAFFLTPFRMWELLAGSVLALGLVAPTQLRWLREWLAALGLVAIFAAGFLYSDGTPFPGPAALAPVLGAVSILYAGASGPTYVGALLRSRLFVYVGLISYSLYLWHWPLFSLAQYINGMEAYKPAYLLLLLAVAFALSMASYHCVEQPFRRPARRLRPWFRPTASAISMAVLGLFCLTGLLKDGFVKRFDDEVIALDKARSPAVPHIECIKRQPEAACVLGNAKSAPDMLLWGDSHMLSWGPAFHASLLQSGKSALFMPHLACPPLLGADNIQNPSCAATNAEIEKFLLKHAHIRTVVLAGFWSNYFREGGALRAVLPNGLQVTGVKAAQHGLGKTLDWLRDHGRTTVLMGPVPVFNRSVPALLALEASGAHQPSRSSDAEQRQKNDAFTLVVNGFLPSPSFRYVDSIGWLCATECKWVDDGISLYRDSHHLSVYGALLLEPKLRSSLIVAPAEAAVSGSVTTKGHLRPAVD